VTGGSPFFVVLVRLTITAGIYGVLPELELLLWLRAVSGSPGKVLVVQPDESVFDADTERVRTFRADEFTVSPERVAVLVEMLRSLGLPRRHPRIEDSGDPEIAWWADATLEVNLNGDSGRLEFGFGPDGVPGRDAAAMTGLFRTLFDCASVRSAWSGFLTPRSEAGA
jgi:hypothetical protein